MRPPQDVLNLECLLSDSHTILPGFRCSVSFVLSETCVKMKPLKERYGLILKSIEPFIGPENAKNCYEEMSEIKIWVESNGQKLEFNGSKLSVWIKVTKCQK